MSEDEDASAADSIFREATEHLESLKAQLEPVESLEELDDEALESVLGDVDALVNVATELEDLLETVDLENLPEAVDGDELLEAIDVGEIPEALDGDDEGGVGDVVDFSQVFDAVDLLSAWNATDLTDIWKETQELEEAVDDLASSEDGGLASEAASAVTGDDELVGGEDGLLGGDEDDGLLDDVDPKDALGSIDVEQNPEAYQVFIQQQATEGIDEFRDALLKTHGKFEKLYELNREKMRRQDTSTNSRNPTAASTIQTDRRDLGGGARYSTVPRKVKYSTAPTRKRIYGRRFELERKRRGYDDD
ncbi:hypothetical protein [Halostagnicola sp. A-GB9-2]|uniref:hypothetical protein n=1 Tax=Halostagnicola sp. A-GB9-2 TaxID=3048066 RepID=UPI0024BFEC9A|nr:hypothetical protein [Halostagnicola sp. A-GB9-2]MDJ1431722.1 hypothetical protein [Halostagnicola sp. A-GB9-2]